MTKKKKKITRLSTAVMRNICAEALPPTQRRENSKAKIILCNNTGVCDGLSPIDSNGECLALSVCCMGVALILTEKIECSYWK